MKYKMRSYIPILVLSLVAACALSCKKDEDSSSFKTFSGSLSFSIPEYVRYGDTFHLALSGVRRGDDDPDRIGYYYTETLLNARDTLRKEKDPADVLPEFDYTVAKDTIGTFSITCYAFASGYSHCSASRTFYLVDPRLNEGSLTGVVFPESAYSFTDSRDGRSYMAVDVDGTSWMAQNLAYPGDGSLGRPYAGCEVMNDVFGRFYTWEEAHDASTCPPGWHLPTDEDWVKLGAKFGSDPSVASPQTAPGAAPALMGDASFNKERMWARPSVSINGKSGLLLLPAGYAVPSSSGWTQSGKGSFAVFWTAGEQDGMGIARYVSNEADGLFAGLYEKQDFAAPVRCVK